MLKELQIKSLINNVRKGIDDVTLLILNLKNF